MKITKDSVVTLSYTLSKDDGEIVETSALTGPVSFLHGEGAILKGLDEKLEGMEAGQEATFEFTPEQAFGRLEDAPKKRILRGEFPKSAQLAVGTRFEAGLPGGQKITLEVVTLDKDEESVEVRLIHPLAGRQISMTVQVLGVRQATKAEIQHRQVLTRPPPPPT